MKWLGKKKKPNAVFSGSTEYWEQRYQSGRNSGAGSYGRLAEFKARFLNGFVADKQIHSVVEWGCGDGNQLQLADYPAYIGLDVSPAAVNLCSELFRGDSSKRFACVDEAIDVNTVKADLALSLDVIYHLVENTIFEQYMILLFNSAKKYVIIYSSNQATDSGQAHVRHRVFTDWVSANQPHWNLLEKINNPYSFTEDDPEHTSFADFYIFAMSNDD